MADVAEVRKPRSRVLRGVYFTLGLVCLGMAYLSFLPGIPTFDFVILAAFFFARSSDRFHAWLISHRIFGRIIKGYRSEGFSMRTKVLASLAVVASLSFSMFVLVDIGWLRVLLAAVGIYAVWFIMSRPTQKAP
ncbi:MAG TPA: YbaN family protein [Acidimicrobiia bacterium]|nr:YbaN family protein [Acidimicrobiia bacterium]